MASAKTRSSSDFWSGGLLNLREISWVRGGYLEVFGGAAEAEELGQVQLLLVELFDEVVGGVEQRLHDLRGLLICMGRISIERLKYFYTANYLLGKKQPSYFLGLDLGRRFFGAATSTACLSESFPERARCSSRSKANQTRCGTSTTSSCSCWRSVDSRSGSSTGSQGRT